MLNHLFRFSAAYFVLAIIILVGLYYQPMLPDTLVVQWGGIQEKPTNYMSRSMFLWGLPVSALLIVWFVIFMMSRGMKYEDQEQSGSVVSHIAFVTTALFLAIEVWIVYANTADITMSTSMFVTYVFSGLLVMLGNIMSKIKPNRTSGFRTPWTLRSDETWRATHRFGGRLMIISGVLMLACSFISDDRSWTMTNAVFWWLLAILTPCIYSFIHYRNNRDRV